MTISALAVQGHSPPKPLAMGVRPPGLLRLQVGIRRPDWGSTQQNGDENRQVGDRHDVRRCRALRRGKNERRKNKEHQCRQKQARADFPIDRAGAWQIHNG